MPFRVLDRQAKKLLVLAVSVAPGGWPQVRAWINDLASELQGLGPDTMSAVRADESGPAPDEPTP